ncbi:MAG: ATP-dependent DNA helicase RecG [Lachnospiraceae bacterium]|nr:ATP-dependent DNA helicase RecG [Lachnospiraceae bacterium]
MNLSDNITTLKGIGEKSAALFHKLNIYTLEDLIRHYPRDYEEYASPVGIRFAERDCIQSLRVTIKKVESIKRVRNLQILNVLAGDSENSIVLTWFNMPYLKNKLRSGEHMIIRGIPFLKNGRLTMEQPELFTEKEYEGKQGQLLPKYALTKGLTSNAIMKAVRQVLDSKVLEKEFLPANIRKEYELAEYNYAVSTIHFPNCMDDLVFARKRLVFDEFFLFILSLRYLKETTEKIKNDFTFSKQNITLNLLEQLPFKLTNAQLRAFEDVKENMNSEYVMNRLIQGDVGSGKTIVAALALCLASENGYQGAMMAPTEVLARQHYEYFVELKEKYQLPIHPILLTGSMTAKEKRTVRERIELGMADIIIGTHTLFQESVIYKNLALVITDEQHRFGVRQREMLMEKGTCPHVLVMSATPIPRTLAIIIYGDLDISVIDELPSNRIPIKNCVVDTSYREKAYQFITKEVYGGHQVYVICPMVEESENMEAENVIDYAKMLQTKLPSDITISYLHGKMKAKEKNDIMERFAANEIQVLVSTTVIEVGVNVPNATVMMVENAECFGLAQLHQLRGRVGRGGNQSYCIFVNGSSKKDTKKRLDILNKSNDGFFISSEDLKLRGPGDLFGFRQSGILEFKIGDIFTDAAILQNASDAASIFSDKEIMKKAEYSELNKKLELYLQNDLNSLSL